MFSSCGDKRKEENRGQKIRHLEALLLLLEALTGDERYSDIIADMLEQERKGGSVTMCDLIDKYEQKGIQKGIQKGMQKGMQKGEENAILTSAKNLMVNLKLSAEQAMAAMGVPKEEQQKYLQMMK